MTTKTVPFNFPAIYDLPPFFTLQPVLNTREKQLEMWSQFILDYARHYRIYELSIPEVAETPLFKNTKINRRLSTEAIRSCLDYLVSKGNGEWLDNNKNRLLVYWKTPEQWANILHTKVQENGMIDTVLTLFELIEGEMMENEEFYKLDNRILMKALNILEKRGVAKVFSGSQSADHVGIKFFK